MDIIDVIKRSDKQLTKRFDYFLDYMKKESERPISRSVYLLSVTGHFLTAIGLSWLFFYFYSDWTIVSLLLSGSVAWSWGKAMGGMFCSRRIYLGTTIPLFWILLAMGLFNFYVFCPA